MPVAPKLENMPDLLTVEQASRILQVSKNQAYGMVANGSLPSIRFGRKCIRIPKNELACLLGASPFLATNPELEPSEELDRSCFVLRVAASSGSRTCSLCGKPTEPVLGVELCRTVGYAAVCIDCGKRYVPELTDLLQFSRLVEYFRARPTRRVNHE